MYDVNPTTNLMAVFAVAVGAALAGACGLVFLCRGRGGWRLGPALALVALLAVVAALGCSEYLWAGAVLAGGCGLVWLVSLPRTAHVCRRLWSLAGSARLQWGALMVCGAALAAHLVVRIDQGAGPQEPVSDPGMSSRASLEPDAIHHLFTDRGRPVPVYTHSTFTPSTPEHEDRLIAANQLTNQVIRIEDEEQNCNCHGWTFTGGRFWLMGNGVDKILADNGYEQVEYPQPGDLAVYRDVDGQILHSGVVRLADEDTDLILIESKWATLGRFLHPPGKCGYGNLCSYYHTDRPGGHLLQNATLTDLDAKESRTAE